jgi:hypothetical protein
MLQMEKILPYLKKSGSTIIAIDAPAHGLSSGKSLIFLNMHIYPDSKSNPPTSLGIR